ncbi:MAG TPA: hypothetical protein VD710_00340 [Nitrososphaeraceae archaeon]|nr:hypothetical protein [Nitrososphaeraceae archaeon]
MANANNPAMWNSLIWLSISIAIIIILHIVLPFPISFIVSLIAVFSLSIYRNDRALRKAGMGGIKDWYKSVFSSGFGPRWGTGINGSAYQPLKFLCINCGNEHKEIACPNCGSKGVRPV